ncbi:MAG: ATP-binding protein, partial [Ramlibacter sp.]
HQPLSMTLVDLNEVVARCRESLVTGTEDRAVQWHISALPTVRGDAALLGRALSNLMGNALKYSARSNPAIIEVFADASTAGEHRICVRDNGVGVDMRYAHRLFQVFSRLHHSDEFEGTGIGLANVRRIIDRHGSRVWAQGEPGKGSEFWIALPA